MVYTASKHIRGADKTACLNSTVDDAQQLDEAIQHNLLLGMRPKSVPPHSQHKFLWSSKVHIVCRLIRDGKGCSWYQMFGIIFEQQYCSYMYIGVWLWSQLWYYDIPLLLSFPPSLGGGGGGGGGRSRVIPRVHNYYCGAT